MLVPPRRVRALRALLLACALAVVGLIGTAATASADSNMRFWQFNLCGARIESPCNYGREQPVADAMKSSIENFKPDAVSLNEACESQFAHTIWNLNAGGIWSMHGRFHVGRFLLEEDKPKFTCNVYDGSRRFGLAFFSRQRILMEPTAHVLPEPDPATGNNILYCGVVELYRPSIYCSVHISGNEANKGAQIQRVSEIVNPWVDDGIPVVLMGDFNVEPRDYRLNPIYHSVFGPSTTGTHPYGRFEEVDQYHGGTGRCRCGEPTFGPKKLDYIFVSARDFYGQDGDATSSSLSDHTPLRGWAVLDHTP